MYRTTNVAGLLEIMKSLQGERSQTDFAEQLGVSTSYLSDVYNMRRHPGRSMLKTMGVNTFTSYLVPESTISAALTTSMGGHLDHKENSEENRQKINTKANRRAKR